MAPKTTAFALTAAHVAILTSLVSATETNPLYVGADARPLAENGYIQVNQNLKDANGNVAAVLTDLGRANVPAAAPAETPKVSFIIAQVAALPDIKRGGGNKSPRESKYPLGTIPLGGAAFIPHPGIDAEGLKKLSKQFGSTVATFNQNNSDKYMTSRTIEDGAKAGFVGQNEDGTPNPEAYAGIAGIAIYHRPVSEKKVRAPKAAPPASGEQGTQTA
jgi:hypothetical protein